MSYRFIDNWREIVPWCQELESRVTALEPKEDEMPPNSGACKCKVCGIDFEAIPGTMQFDFCQKCEANLLRVQVKEACEKLLTIKKELKEVHAHEEWSESKVRAEIYAILIKHFGL